MSASANGSLGSTPVMAAQYLSAGAHTESSHQLDTMSLYHFMTSNTATAPRHAVVPVYLPGHP
jgi:hypothetical protein